MKLKLLLFYLAIAFAITVINGEEEDSDEGEDISINLVDDEFTPEFTRQARGSVGTRQRYKNHPRHSTYRHSQHAPASQNRRYYQDPRYSRQYLDEVDANGYAAVLG